MLIAFAKVVNVGLTLRANNATRIIWVKIKIIFM